MTKSTLKKDTSTPLSYSASNQSSSLQGVKQDTVVNLQSKLQDFKKIIELQQSQLQEEVSKREKIQKAFNASKLSNEQTILNKIQ